jgi:hypothetical protein
MRAGVEVVGVPVAIEVTIPLVPVQRSNDMPGHPERHRLRTSAPENWPH